MNRKIVIAFESFPPDLLLELAKNIGNDLADLGLSCVHSRCSDISVSPDDISTLGASDDVIVLGWIVGK